MPCDGEDGDEDATDGVLVCCDGYFVIVSKFKHGFRKAYGFLMKSSDVRFFFIIKTVSHV